MKASYKNPKGGLSAAGRRAINRQTGSNLKAPVKGRPKTLSQMRRKGSFLIRMGSANGPMTKNGKPTRLALSLRAWGYRGATKAGAVAMGRRLLRRYQNAKGR